MSRVFSPSFRRVIRLQILFVLAAALFLWWPSTPSAKPATHVIDMDMTQFAFEPGRMTVNQGDTVVLKLTASDVVHGFYLDGYGLKTRVEPGIAQQVEFVADQPGKFRYRCSVSCGPMHPFMIGEMVVSPNQPFWKAAGVIVIALAGLISHVWFNDTKGVLDEQTQQEQ